MVQAFLPLLGPTAVAPPTSETDETQPLATTHEAQLTSAETNSAVLQPIAGAAGFELETYTTLSSDDSSKPSRLDNPSSHRLSSPAAAVDHTSASDPASAADPATPSSSSHASQDSQAAAADVITTEALNLTNTPGVTATEQMVVVSGTVDIRPASSGPILPTPGAEDDTRHAAVALHTGAGSELTPLSGHDAASGSAQTSCEDSNAAAKILVSCVSDVHLTRSTPDAATEKFCADSTAGQPMIADSAEVDVQQPTFAHSSAADGNLTSLDSTTLASDSEASVIGTESPAALPCLPSTAASHETSPAMPSLSRLAANTSPNRNGIVSTIMTKISAVAHLVRVTLMPAQQSQPIRDKGKGRATAADLHRMAAQARKTVKHTSNQVLTKSEAHQLRLAHREADFVRRVEAGKRAGAGPSRARSSAMAELLHAAADMAYYVAGAVKGSCEGLLRTFW